MNKGKKRYVSLMLVVILIITGCTQENRSIDSEPKTDELNTSIESENTIIFDNDPDEKSSNVDSVETDKEKEHITQLENLTSKMNISYDEQISIIDKGKDLIKNVLVERPVIHKRNWATKVAGIDTFGFVVENSEIVEVVSVKENQVLYIDKKTRPGWLKAYFIKQQPFKSLDDQEFGEQIAIYISSDELEDLAEHTSLQIGALDEMISSETFESYNYLLVDLDDPSYNGLLDETVHDIYLYDYPSEESKVIGFGLDRDRVRILKKNDNEMPGWALIEMTNYHWTNSQIGWIHMEQVREIGIDDKPLEQFVLKNTLLYLEPKEDSKLVDAYYVEDYTEPLTNGEVFLLRTEVVDENWYWVSDGINGLFAGYVKSDEVYLYFEEWQR